MKSIALSLDATRSRVSTFGHGNPLMVRDLSSGESRQIEVPPDTCCGGVAELVADCDLLITSGLGNGAFRHLDELGVEVRFADEGADAAECLAMAQRGELPPGEPHNCGHHHDHDHHGH